MDFPYYFPKAKVYSVAVAKYRIDVPQPLSNDLFILFRNT